MIQILPYLDETKDIVGDLWIVEEKEPNKFNLLMISSVSKSIEELNETVEMVCYRYDRLTKEDQEKYKDLVITLKENEDKTVSYIK